ncbi:MAG: amino acid racemase [Pseudomonadota bacterium]
MKLLGVIGGVSPESTQIYYRLLNEAARARAGGEHSARILLYALDYGVMIRHYQARDWDAFKREVALGAEHLAKGGAEAIVISSNTTHIAADAAATASGLPVVHMLDALTAVMDRAGARKPLLLGTPVVMGGDYYRPALAARYDGDVLVPDAGEQEEIGRIILDELVNGEVKDASRRTLLDIVNRRREEGVDGVILGCTELCMILDQSHTDLSVFDTTAIHVEAAAAFAFGEA